MLKLKRSNLTVTSNWKIIFGNGFDGLVSTDFSAEQPKTNLDDITSGERTILLASNASLPDTTIPITEHTEVEDSCRIRISGTSMHSIRQCTLVCDCNRIEIFTGSYEEYCRTIDGELLDEFDGTKSYLFEIKLLEPACNVSLKFITSVEQIFVYGMHINLIELPFNIFKPSIDLNNVENMLADSTQSLSDNAEKCKQFIKLHMGSGRNAGPPNMSQLMSFVNMQIGEKLTTGDNFENLIKNDTEDIKEKPSSTTNHDRAESALHDIKLPFGLDHSVDIVKAYFDVKLHEMEQRITNNFEQRLTAMEIKNDEKLNQILEILLQKQ